LLSTHRFGEQTPRVLGRRGFPNIGLVRDALGALVPAMRRGRLPPPPKHAWEGHRGFPLNDAVVAVQTLARRIAEVYRLDIGVVVVTFVEKLEAAGRVELGGPGQRDFFVELRGEYRNQPRVISAILAHEVAHIFLHRNGLHPAPGLAAEILTDTTAVLYGFGAVMADTFKVSEHHEQLVDAVRITTTVNQMGYLTPDEIGYALTRAGFGHLHDVLESNAAREAVRVGRRLAAKELTSPPLRTASWWRVVAYRILRWLAERRKGDGTLTSAQLYRLEPGKVSFRCTVCCQGLRLPTRAVVTATCPRCEAEVPCVT
jgi:hypothetical protein